MVTVIKLKRHRGINQVEGILIRCKSLKLKGFSYNNSMLCYQATVNNEYEFFQQINRCIKRFLDCHKESGHKKGIPTVKFEQDQLICTNCFRASDVMSCPFIDFTVLDVEYKYQDETDHFFIYDIFITRKIVGDFDVDLIDRIEPIQQKPDHWLSASDISDSEFANDLPDYSDSDEEKEVIEGAGTCQLAAAEDNVSSDEGSLAHELGAYRLYGRKHSYMKSCAFIAAHESNDYCIGVDSDDNDDVVFEKKFDSLEKKAEETK